MNRSISIILLSIFLASSAFGVSSRNSVKILEATEEIKTISQQVVKDYFFLQLNPGKLQTKTLINFGLLELDEKLKLIASITNSEDTINVLSFLAYSREQLQETLGVEYDIEQGALMLDYSETLLEGAESIANEHKYSFSKEERTLIRVKNMTFLLERINKYYIAYQLGFEEVNTLRQLELAIEAYENNYRYIKAYPYGNETAEYVKKASEYWPVLKKHYRDYRKHRIPNILYATSRELSVALEELGVYHSKKL